MIPDLTSDLPRRIHNILDEGAINGADRIAFTDEVGHDWTYGQLIETIALVSEELRNLGVGPGDRVLLICENSIAAVVLLYASSLLDAWIVLVNARQSAREVDAIREDCSPRRTIYTHRVSIEACAHGERHGATEHIFARIGSVLVCDLDKNCESEPTYDDPAKQVAVLIYTTGTTGKPKGVMLSHNNLTYVAGRGKRMDSILFDDVGLCLMPIVHSYGLSTMQGVLFAGGHLHIMTRFSEPRVMQMITDGTLTLFMAVPSLFSQLVNSLLSKGTSLKPNKLRYIYSGTAPLDVSLRKQSEQFFGVVMQNGYGLTETSPTISRSNFEFGTDEAHIGAPIPGVEVKLLDLEGKEVPTGESGELHVRGPNIMIGYYGKPELTAAVIDSCGFFNTSDIARLDEEGNLHLEGRTKELIIRSGFNVYPPEVEGEINAHPMVLSSAVVGFTVSGDEEIVAFVEPVRDCTITPAELTQFLKGRLTAYKRPHHIFVVDALPFTPNAKILKNKLKIQAESMLRCDDGSTNGA